jgi:oligopeptide/dipeptide ABC transporter ATP-binding protein
MLLEARGLRRTFRDRAARQRKNAEVAAVAGVDFDLEAGASLALVGESGSGKSTIARLVLRLLPPSAGTIRFLDRDLLSLGARELRETRRSLQAVFQDPWGSLDPRLSIGQTIAEPLIVHRLAAPGEHPARIRRLLSEVGLGELPADRYPHEISGGQRQRVAIARALASEPRLLVADEPASALDAPVRAKILDMLEERRRARGLAILLIAHDLASVRRAADRVAVLYRGRIVEEGPVADVLGRPRHPYTMALVAVSSGAANRISAQLVQREAEGRPAAVAGGCPYHPLCPIAGDRCRIERPELLAEPGRPAGTAVACHFPGGLSSATAGSP